MPDKPYLFPSNKMASCMESGFGLVEAMVAMVIFMIAAAGVGYVLVSSNQQLATVEYALQNQQYGMQATLVGATGSTVPVGAGVQPQPQTVNVTITTASTASSILMQVPTASLSSSFPALPSNQQPPAWWQP